MLTGVYWVIVDLGVILLGGFTAAEGSFVAADAVPPPPPRHAPKPSPRPLVRSGVNRETFRYPGLDYSYLSSGPRVPALRCLARRQSAVTAFLSGLKGQPLVSIDLYQYSAVIAWPPLVNFVEGADRDSFVEPARGENPSRVH